MPHRKNNPARISARGSPAAAAKQRSRLVRGVAHGALFAVGFSAMQFFLEDGGDAKRLFDSRLVDSLRAPLTRYHD